jgi:uncharacterized membrane protein YkvA (DUF1232 family)
MKLSAEAIYNWYRSTIRNPKYRWWVILGTLAYILSPIDIAPDFIPFIGQIDDVVILTVLVSEVSQLLFDRAKTAKRPADAETTETASVDVDVEAVRLN